MKRHYRFYSLFPVISLCVLLNACTVVYKSAGDVMTGYAEEQGVPYMMASHEVALGCAMTEAFTPFLLSFSQVTTPPDRLAILFYLMAGNCTEIRAWQEELRYLRAVYAKNAVEAQDARIAQQRLLALAAQRQLTGYRHLALAIAEPGKDCPALETENEELYWLVGLLNGIQAIMNDIASGGTIEVPMDIAAKVGRAASCLDNGKWWGVPDAIQAAIWMTMPGNYKGETDPESVLLQSLDLGVEQGVFVSQVLAAQVYIGQGRIEQVKEIIRSHASLSKKSSLNQEFEMLNRVAMLQIQAISDRLWTEATGRRTPIGKIGVFWDDPAGPVDAIDIDEIL